MRLETITLSNLRRRKGRMIFLVAGLLLGVGTVVTLLSLSRALTAEAQHKLENFGANILLTPRSDNLSLSYGGITLGGVTVETADILQNDLALIQTIPNSRNVALIAPKTLGAVQLNGKRVLLMGVDPSREFALKRWWQVEGRSLSADDELVVGSSAARNLGLSIGDKVSLQGEPFTIGGILRQTGSQDDHLVLASLPVAQGLLGKPGRLSLVEVSALCSDCPVEDMVQQISSVLPGVEVHAIQQVVKTRMHALEEFRRFSLAVASVVLLVGGLVVFVTMMGSVKERTREIGIFRALGYRRSHIMRLILGESFIVSLFSGVLGYLGGMTVTWAALPFLSEQSSHASHGESASQWLWHPELAAVAVILAVGIGVLASFYPALHASRMDPSEALRTL